MTLSVGTCWPWETTTTSRSARRRFGAQRGRRGSGAYCGGCPPTVCSTTVLTKKNVTFWGSKHTLTLPTSINQSKILWWPKWQQTLQGPLRSHTGESPGNEKQNSLRCSLNAVNDEAEVACSGSVFQMRAPATGKVREPKEASWTARTIRSSGCTYLQYPC